MKPKVLKIPESQLLVAGSPTSVPVIEKGGAKKSLSITTLETALSYPTPTTKPHP